MIQEIEYKAQCIIQQCKVSWKYTRDLLLAKNIDDVEKTQVFKFIQKIFNFLNYGKLEIAEVEKFSYTFCLLDSPFPKYVRTEKLTHGNRVCHSIVQFMYDFFNTCLDVVCSVKEIKCAITNEHCSFKVTVQPLSANQIITDKLDLEILKCVVKHEKIPEIENIDNKLKLLRNFNFLNEQNEITKIGMIHLMYMISFYIEEKNYPSPFDINLEQLIKVKDIKFTSGATLPEDKKVIDI